MNRSTFDALLTSFWMAQLARFRAGEEVIFQPYDGNPRRIENMDERGMFLRETTARAGASSCPVEEFRKDMWALETDAVGATEAMHVKRDRLDIKNYVEFKRDMFDQFKRFESLILHAK